MQIFKSGSWRTPASLKIFSGGAWRSIVSGKAYVNGAWRDVCNFSAPSGGGSGMTLSLSTTSIQAVGTASTLTTGSVSVTPSGGTAPYHYTWTITSNDGLATYTITAPSFATTSVKESGLGAGQDSACSIRCAVTDSSGLSAASATVTARFTNSA